MTRISQSATPTGRMSDGRQENGTTTVANTIVTAATLRRTMTATARVRTATTATSAPVPTIMRTSVGHGSGKIREPRGAARWRRRR